MKSLLSLGHKNYLAFSTKKKPLEIVVRTDHLRRYMNEPKSPREVSHAIKMRGEWIMSLIFALMMYGVSDKLFPGTFVDRNIFVDFYDQKAYYIKQKYLNGELK